MGWPWWKFSTSGKDKVTVMDKECLVVAAHNTENEELNLRWISKQNQRMEPMEDSEWSAIPPHGQRLIMQLQKQISLLLNKVEKQQRHIRKNLPKPTEPKKQQNQSKRNKQKLKTKSNGSGYKKTMEQKPKVTPRPTVSHRARRNRNRRNKRYRNW